MTRDDSPRPSEEPTERVADDPTDSFDLESPDSVSIGVTRGELDLEVGQPGEYPDRADVSVRPEGTHVLLTVDAAAGDHATGHADAELTLEEARRLRDLLEETVRWMADDGN
ncbi:hypothetical protein [Natronobeatus ordinarius]|uniref:hypothetical protein n=1 Tax=Natronobeatus ordinarius TaxID=2963433 RepID=UPI0020CE56D9|nr:hypothetical protein [Natronobeatus ordinarius]